MALVGGKVGDSKPGVYNYGFIRDMIFFLMSDVRCPMLDVEDHVNYEN